MEKIKKILKKYKIFLFLLLCLIFLIVLKIAAKENFQVLETNPKNNQEKVNLETTIFLTFQKTPVFNNLEIKINPSVTFSVKVDRQTLAIQPNEQLKPDTEYKVELVNLKNRQNTFSFSFKTLQLTPISNQTEANIRQYYNDLEKKTYEEMPLFDYVPFSSKNFSLDYIKPLTLQVTLKEDTPAARQEVLNWINSKAVNPQTHKIIWKTR